MKPSAQDLRDRILQALDAGREAQRALARRLCVSRVFGEQLWQRWRRTGSRRPRPHTGGRQRALQEPLELLAPEGAQHPAAPLAEVRERVVAAHGPQVSPATLCRAPQRLLQERAIQRVHVDLVVVEPAAKPAV